MITTDNIFCSSNVQNVFGYHIQCEIQARPLADMNCERPPEIVGIGTVESVDTREPTETIIGDVGSLPPTVRPTISTTEVVTTSTAFSTTTVTVSSSTEERRTAPPAPPAPPSTFVPTTRPTAARTGNVVIMRTTPSLPKQDQMQQHQPRPPLVLGSPLYKAKSSEKDIVVKDVLRQDNAVIIYWDTEATNILGFRVIYRLFGDNSFKQAPPLEASEREFKIKNVPSQVKLFASSTLRKPSRKEKEVKTPRRKRLVKITKKVTEVLQYWIMIGITMRLVIFDNMHVIFSGVRIIKDYNTHNIVINVQ